MTFAERLKELRLKRGFTQEELANKIGIAKSTLTGYEKGNREPDFFKIKKLTQVLEVDADYLLGISKSSLHDNVQETAIEQEYIAMAKELKKYNITHQDMEKIIKILTLMKQE